MALPIGKTQAFTGVEWLKGHFRQDLDRAVSGSPFTVDHLCGIACQETAYFWLSFIKRLPPEEILSRCVLDASGDASSTSRGAFPHNTAAFRARYGETFTEMLIAEANATRKLRGFKPQTWVYKGYGLFQYDLQSVTTDEAFFRERQWGSLGECLQRVMAELTAKYAAQRDVWKAIRAYNGAGAAAAEYAANVKQYAEWSAEVALNAPV